MGRSKEVGSHVWIGHVRKRRAVLEPVPPERAGNLMPGCAGNFYLAGVRIETVVELSLVKTQQ